MTVATLGYLAAALNVAGNLMLAKLNVWGRIVRLVVNVVWIAYAVQIDGGEPMAANHIAFFAINIYGFTSWRRQSKRDEHGRAKIDDDDDVREIRRLGKAGVLQREIAVMYGVDKSTISKICRRKTWSHVE